MPVARGKTSPAAVLPPASAPPVTEERAAAIKKVSPPAALGAASSTDEPREKERLLDDVLLAHNDNDPRLDTAFLALSPETKRAFRRKYRTLPPERRNDRGTILYLLGKNLRTPEDWAVMREAVAEPPCLSLSDCSKPPAPEEGNGEAGDAVTLAYPALVALEQAEQALAGRDAAARQEASAVVRAARGSRIEIVAKKADELGSR